MTEDIAASEHAASEIPPATSLSARAEARAAAKARRRKQIERREACFNLFASGYTPHEIAKAMKASAATIRRLIDQAISDRRLDAPDRYAHVQVARLSKMLCALDNKLERGDTRAVAPLMKVLAALDRYHGVDARYVRLAPAAPGRFAAPVVNAKLALTHATAFAAEPTHIAVEPTHIADVADLGA